MKAFSLTAFRSTGTVVLALMLAPVLALAEGQAAPTSVTVSQPTPTTVRGQLALSARLTTADGKPISGQDIEFYVPVQLFGSREAFIGSATTDSTGRATLLYQPAETGKQGIVARFVGVDALAPSKASADIQVSEALPALKTEALPFAGLREWLPLALLGGVLVVWAVLLGVFLGTVRGIRQAV